jgi:hypothetical protein
MDLHSRGLFANQSMHTPKRGPHAPGRLALALGVGLVLCLVLACSDRGRVVVLTEEPTAQVWVDGVQTGAIGPDGFEVAAGPHTVEVRAEGYHPWSTEIEVTSGRPTVLQVDLLGLAAFLVVRSNVRGDTVWIDDTPMGPSGPHSHEIPWGPHVVRVERPGYTPFVQEVYLEPDETQTVQAALVGVGGGRTETRTKIVPIPVGGLPYPYRYYPYRYYGPRWSPVPRPPVPRAPRPPLPRAPRLPLPPLP